MVIQIVVGKARMLIIAFCVDTATVSALLLLADKQVSRIVQADLLFLKLMINNQNGLGHKPSVSIRIYV